MQKLGSFKRWFSVSQAAALLETAFNEQITDSDVLEQIGAGEIPIWWDATGRYAVPIARGCHCFGLLSPSSVGGRSVDAKRREQWFWQSDQVQLLEGMYEIAIGARRERQEVFDGDRAGQIVFSDGVLLRDADGESLLQVLRRMPGRAAGSSVVKDFIVDIEFPNPDVFRVASADLRRLLNGESASPRVNQMAEETGKRERETLLKQVGAMATLLAEKAALYRRGEKPNASQIADAVVDLVAEIPDVNCNGLGRSSIRASVTEGVDLLRK